MPTFNCFKYRFQSILLYSLHLVTTCLFEINWNHTHFTFIEINTAQFFETISSKHSGSLTISRKKCKNAQSTFFSKTDLNISYALIVFGKSYFFLYWVHPIGLNPAFHKNYNIFDRRQYNLSTNSQSMQVLWVYLGQ